MITLKQVNKRLNELGIKAELVKGDGYFYFFGDDADNLPQSGVYGVSRLNDLSLERWVEEFLTLAKLPKGMDHAY